MFPLAKVLQRGLNDFFLRSGETSDIIVRMPKLYSLQDLVDLDEAGLYEAAAEVAESLGLPYNVTQETLNV